MLVNATTVNKYILPTPEEPVRALREANLKVVMLLKEQGVRAV